MTAIAMTMFETAVLHPALKFTADRENGPGIHYSVQKHIYWLAKSPKFYSGKKLNEKSMNSRRTEEYVR